MRSAILMCFSIFLLSQAHSLRAAPTSSIEENLWSLSLEDLMNVKVTTGSLLSHASDESPAAITIIRRDQIENSGAKNLANLLEQHVPGMMLMTHSEGDKIGLRGLIAAENYKLLLLVNGKNITNMVYEGAILEIDQWELGDIEKVEVIRGPGSVTYGTGAIAGIINIITKTAADNLPTLAVGISSNDTYQSKGINAQYANTFEDLGIYAFASYRNTDGYNNPNYFVLSPSDPSNNRYLGKSSGDITGPQAYLADGNERAQIKTHIGIKYGDNFSAWLRFTQSGQTRSFTQQRFTLDTQGNNGELVNPRSTGTRGLAFSADYKHTLSETSNLKTLLTIDSQEYIRWDFSNRQSAIKSSDNIRDYAFSQNRATGTLLYEATPNADFNYIVGYEYSQIQARAPWGKSADYLLIQEGSHIVSNDATSVYLQNPTLANMPNPNKLIEVGKGMDFDTHTHLLEGRYQLTDHQQLFYAHRLDFPNVSDSMFSPRLSLVSTINETNTLVSTVQRAQRMMPLRAQYQNYIADQSSNNETLDSVEFSYTNHWIPDANINIRAFYNDINAVGYTGTRLEFLSEFQLYGLEMTSTYKINDIELTLNHSFLDLLTLKMNPELKTGNSRNNISYADYYLNTRSKVPVLLEGFGDGLNNWSKNTTKLLFTKHFMNQRLTAHINAQIFWDLEGSYDEMNMYQRSYDDFDTSVLSTEAQALFAQQKTEFERERALLDATGAYKTDYSVNASLTYLWSLSNKSELNIKVFAENIFGSKRLYNVSTGSNRHYPERLSFLEEPISYGISIHIRYP